MKQEKWDDVLESYNANIAYINVDLILCIIIIVHLGRQIVPCRSRELFNCK